MNDDALKQLLQQADSAAGGPPTLPSDLARRVRLLAARRRQRTRVGLSAAAVLLLAVGTSLMWPNVEPDISPTGGNAGQTGVVVNPAGDADSARLRAEIEMLESEARMRIELVRQTRELIKRSEAVKESNGQTSFPDAVANVRREVDQAAFTLVSQADRICREQNLCVSAARKYQRVVELFPNSCWATVARQRLSELENKGELL